MGSLTNSGPHQYLGRWGLLHYSGEVRAREGKRDSRDRWPWLLAHRQRILHLLWTHAHEPRWRDSPGKCGYCFWQDSGWCHYAQKGQFWRSGNRREKDRIEECLHMFLAKRGGRNSGLGWFESRSTLPSNHRAGAISLPFYLARIHGLSNSFLELLWNIRTDQILLACSEIDFDSVKAGNSE